MPFAASTFLFGPKCRCLRRHLHMATGCVQVAAFLAFLRNFCWSSLGVGSMEPKPPSPRCLLLFRLRPLSLSLSLVLADHFGRKQLLSLLLKISHYGLRSVYKFCCPVVLFQRYPFEPGFIVHARSSCSEQ
ncbi:hypothetical protein M514_25245 [Trichuris suis]|uniref:Uncharacterized protein n=1 Tax=Trichuris suis TaxID=68888 RepID=A0A085MZF4_9BILA|nr:hypothetical protein M514_25245 [Trichuris suis]